MSNLNLTATTYRYIPQPEQGLLDFVQHDDLTARIAKIFQRLGVGCLGVRVDVYVRSSPRVKANSSYVWALFLKRGSVK